MSRSMYAVTLSCLLISNSLFAMDLTSGNLTTGDLKKLMWLSLASISAWVGAECSHQMGLLPDSVGTGPQSVVGNLCTLFFVAGGARLGMSCYFRHQLNKPSLYAYCEHQAENNPDLDQMAHFRVDNIAYALEHCGNANEWLSEYEENFKEAWKTLEEQFDLREKDRKRLEEIQCMFDHKRAFNLTKSAIKR